MTPLNLLIAFPYFSKQVLKFLRAQDHARFRLMVDSGAFTAHMGGEPIQLDDYCRFLDALECLRPFDAVQLDVIGDHDASLRNFETMRARGYNVLPVFTRGAPLELLDHLFTLNPYVLIGGVAVGENKRGYVKHLMPHIQGRKVHLLGFVDRNFIKAIRPFSVDASSWNNGSKYGWLHLYQGAGRVEILGRKDIAKMPFPELVRLARHSGITPDHLEHLRHDSAYAGQSPTIGPKGTVCWLTAYAHVAMSLDIELNLGTRYYLAAGSAADLDLLFNAYAAQPRYSVGSNRPASLNASLRS